jgi:hypothetical protein
MAKTYEPIATTTLGSAAASVTFSTISGAYTDLVLVMSIRGSSDIESDIGMQLNSDTGSNYSMQRIYGQGASAGSDRTSNSTSINFGRQGGDSFALNIMHLMNYANTTTYKTILNRSGHAGTSSIVLANVGLWRNTAAISTITLIQTGAQNYKAGSTFSLYGIASA